MPKKRHPLSDKRNDSYFYYYSRPVATYKGVDIWKHKHKKTGLLTFYSKETGVHSRTLEAAKKAIDTWEHKQYKKDKRRI